QREAPHVTILHRPCPEWVLAVEQGIIEGSEALAVVEPPVHQLLTQGADVLVLGCTHFPFLSEAIMQCAGDTVPILETGPAVARQLQRQLETHGRARQSGPGGWEFLTSGNPHTLERLASRLLQTPVMVERLPA